MFRLAAIRELHDEIDDLFVRFLARPTVVREFDRVYFSDLIVPDPPFAVDSATGSAAFPFVRRVAGAPVPPVGLGGSQYARKTGNVRGRITCDYPTVFLLGWSVLVHRRGALRQAEPGSGSEFHGHWLQDIHRTAAAQPVGPVGTCGGRPSVGGGWVDGREGLRVRFGAPWVLAQGD